MMKSSKMSSGPSNSPALPRTTCASMDRLMLLEQTTPNDSFDLALYASEGGAPGGVDGRGKRGIVIKGSFSQ